MEVGEERKILRTWDEVKAEIKRLGLADLEHFIRSVEWGSVRDRLQGLERIQWGLFEKERGLDPDLVIQVAEGKLPEQAPTLENRLAEIKESSARIGRPVDWFIVTAPYETSSLDLEKKYSAKFIEGEVRDDILHAMMSPIKKGDDVELFIDVWDCQYSLALSKGYAGTERIEVPAKLEKQLDKVANRIIYDENQGAINMSGMYYPKTEKSAKALLVLYKASVKVI